MADDEDDFDHELELTAEDDGLSALDKLSQMEVIAKDSGGFSQNPPYKPEFAIIAREHCAYLGATTADLAERIGVGVATIKRWIVRYPEFRDATRVGKKIADKMVEDALYQRATGYNIKVERLFHTDGVVTRAHTMEHIPADVKAAFLWLKNRDPEKWRDQKELTVNGGAPQLPGGVTLQEVARWLQMVQMAERMNQTVAVGAIEYSGDKDDG